MARTYLGHGMADSGHALHSSIHLKTTRPVGGGADFGKVIQSTVPASGLLKRNKVLSMREMGYCTKEA